MTAIDFILYCSGASIIMLSIAASIRVAFGVRDISSRVVDVPKEPVVQQGEGLIGRLNEFQTSRFAVPVRQRTENQDVEVISPRLVNRR